MISSLTTVPAKAGRKKVMWPRPHHLFDFPTPSLISTRTTRHQSLARSLLTRLEISGCYVPETHALTGGMSVSIASVASELTGERGGPRDGVTILGGEPMAQLEPLLALLHQLKRTGVHVAVYTGYTLEALHARNRPAISAAMELIDLLIDGPYIHHLADGTGQWRGSRNQRLIENPGRHFTRHTELVGG
jgi:anaerobic ribonucleoside-triphosphate reductase activating protein